MWVPDPFFKQATVLIADQRSFSAEYLSHTLAGLGCKVIGPFEDRRALDEWLSGDHGSVSGAVVALDWIGRADDEVFATLGTRRIPYLPVDNAPWQHLGTLPASFSWPYAAFQVLEALQAMVFQSLTPNQRPHA